MTKKFHHTKETPYYWINGYSLYMQEEDVNNYVNEVKKELSDIFPSIEFDTRAEGMFHFNDDADRAFFELRFSDELQVSI
jgi:hypothetical protein